MSVVQSQIPVDVPPAEVRRQADLGSAITLCMSLGGKSHKVVEGDLELAAGQLSRWIGGQEGIKWERLDALMTLCGNDAPILWMAHRRGWDLHSMRRLETETERENRLLREENTALRRALRATP
jgi:hypothetical protein